jgi:hypothetical protein
VPPVTAERALAPQGVGNCLGEIREEYGEPQPQDDLELEPDSAFASEEVADEDYGSQCGDDLKNEHHRVLDQYTRVEFHECRTDRRNDDLGIEEGGERYALTKRCGFYGNNSELIP